MQAGLRLTARCKNDSLSPSQAFREQLTSPRSPRSPVVPTTCCSARISRRRWGTPPHAAPLAAEPATPRTAPPQLDTSCSDGPSRASSPEPATPKPVYDCVDLVTQSLAVNLTLDEYKQTLQAAGSIAQYLPAAASVPVTTSTAGSSGCAGAPGSVTMDPTASHLSISSQDLEGMSLCTHCRYPCYLSGMPPCEASHYLQMWDADSSLKPRNFDARMQLKLAGVADIAAVSIGGRANGRWKPDNQDNFLVQPTAGSSGSTSSAAIGVFDGHGRLGGQAAAIVKQAMSERLAALEAEAVAEAAAGGLQGAASLLDSCFTAAEAAIEESGQDFTKSGCTAVLALLHQDTLSVAWAGDSRAVFGVCDHAGTSFLGSALGSSDGTAASLSSGDMPSAGASASFDGSSIGGLGMGAWPGPLCAAVPLTEDHKPDKPAEKERISAAGGRVTRLATDRFGNPAGPFRVFLPDNWSPGLALSRAFGDTLAATIGITAKPEVTVLPLPTPPATSAPMAAVAAGISNSTASSCCSSAEGEAEAPPGNRHVLIVATDGLWEWISNTTAVGIASGAPTAEDAAHALAEAAQKQWAVRYRGRNCDDITVVVAFLDR